MSYLRLADFEEVIIVQKDDDEENVVNDFATNDKVVRRLESFENVVVFVASSSSSTVNYVPKPLKPELADPDSAIHQHEIEISGTNTNGNI